MEIVQHLSCDYSIALSCQNDNRKAKKRSETFQFNQPMFFLQNLGNMVTLELQIQKWLNSVASEITTWKYNQ